MSQPNAIYFPDGAGYLLVKVLQSINDCSRIESNVMLVRSMEDNKLYIRKTVALTARSVSGIPNEIEYQPSFHLIPRVKDVTKHMDKLSGEYYWAIYMEYCNAGDLRGLSEIYATKDHGQIPEPLIWKFIADMIQILIFLRDQEICHKDIYPQNVYMRYDLEDLGNPWPDFVLGDFGWAVPLDDKNFEMDHWLFLQLLWYLCVDEEDMIDFGVVDRLHLLEELRVTVKCLFEVCLAAEPCLRWKIRNAVPDLPTDPAQDPLDWIMENILPRANSALERWRRTTERDIPIKPSAASRAENNGNVWPPSLNQIIEDWQLVRVTPCSDDSGKITIHSLAKTSRDGYRDFPALVKTSPGPVDLDHVYCFDADGTLLPPVDPLNDIYRGSSVHHFLIQLKIREKGCICGEVTGETDGDETGKEESDLVHKKSGSTSDSALAVKKDAIDAAEEPPKPGVIGLLSLLGKAVVRLTKIR